MPMIDLDAALNACQAITADATTYGIPHKTMTQMLCDALRALPTVQPEPGPALGADDRLERVKEALAEALWCAYDCTRVWSAWSYKTMSANDFEAIAQNDDRITEIAQAAILAIPGPTPAQLLADALALPEVRALVEAFGQRQSADTMQEFEDAEAEIVAALAKLKGGA